MEYKRKLLIKYSLEFIVIVVGISVTFWIDEWNRNRLEDIQHIKDINSIIDDLDYDSITIVRVNSALEVGDKKTKEIIELIEKKQQNKPAIATVVNFGVSFLHLKDIEKIEKPTEDAIPKTKPVNVFFPVLSIDIIIIPKVAITIAIQTFTEIVSFKNKNPSSAVINGIAARQSNVTAADVLVIE